MIGAVSSAPSLVKPFCAKMNLYEVSRRDYAISLEDLPRAIMAIMLTSRVHE